LRSDPVAAHEWEPRLGRRPWDRGQQRRRFSGRPVDDSQPRRRHERQAPGRHRPGSGAAYAASGEEVITGKGPPCLDEPREPTCIAFAIRAATSCAGRGRKSTFRTSREIERSAPRVQIDAGEVSQNDAPVLGVQAPPNAGWPSFVFASGPIGTSGMSVLPPTPGRALSDAGRAGRRRRCAGCRAAGRCAARPCSARP
jgi:hypothetical protein